MCSHQPPCPPADHRDRDAARTVAFHPEQGWSLLCNGVIVFDDMGEILPGGRVIPPHCPARVRLPAARVRSGAADQPGPAGLPQLTRIAPVAMSRGMSIFPLADLARRQAGSLHRRDRARSSSWKQALMEAGEERE